MKKIVFSQEPIQGKLSDHQPLVFLLVNGTKEEHIWDYMVRTWHYLGYEQMIGARVKYLVLFGDTPIAAISFNRASFRVAVRDTYFDWNDSCRQKLLHHVVNNNRFLILPCIRIKNLASHILSLSLKRLRVDWLKLYGVKLYAVETFVGEQYAGICYKAANWCYLGQTRGFGKLGKAFVYHGKCKSVFLYLYLSKKRLMKLIPQSLRRSNPTLENTRNWQMTISIPDWSSDLFAQIGLNEQSVARIAAHLTEYLDAFKSCFRIKSQQKHSETYIKGLLSDLDRKSIEPIALRYEDEKAVRTMQLFLKDAP